MRSRCDPAQLQPRSRTGTLQVAFSSVFFSKGGGETPSCDFLRCEEKATGEEYVLYPLVMDFLKGIAGFAGRHML